MDKNTLKIIFSTPKYMKNYQENRKLGNFVDATVHCMHPNSKDWTVYSAHSYLLSVSSPYINLLVETSFKNKPDGIWCLFKYPIKVIQQREVFQFNPSCYHDKNDNSLYISLESVCNGDCKENCSKLFTLGKYHSVIINSFLSEANELIFVVKGLDPIFLKYTLCAIYNEDFTIEEDHINIFLSFIEKLELSSFESVKAKIMKCRISLEHKDLGKESFAPNTCYIGMQKDSVQNYLTGLKKLPMYSGIPKQGKKTSISSVHGSNFFCFENLLEQVYTCTSIKKSTVIVANHKTVLDPNGETSTSNFIGLNVVEQNNISASVNNFNFQIKNLLGLNIKNTVPSKKVAEHTMETVHSNLICQDAIFLSTKIYCILLSNYSESYVSTKWDSNCLDFLFITSLHTFIHILHSEFFTNIYIPKEYSLGLRYQYFDYDFKKEHLEKLTIFGGNFTNLLFESADETTALPISLLTNKDMNRSNKKGTYQQRLVLGKVFDCHLMNQKSVLYCKEKKFYMTSHYRKSASRVKKVMKHIFCKKIKIKNIYIGVRNNLNNVSTEYSLNSTKSLRMFSNSFKNLNYNGMVVTRATIGKLKFFGTAMEKVKVSNEYKKNYVNKSSAKLFYTELKFRTEDKLHEISYGSSNKIGSKEIKLQYKRSFDTFYENNDYVEVTSYSKLLKLELDLQQDYICPDSSYIKDKTIDEIIQRNVSSKDHALYLSNLSDGVVFAERPALTSPEVYNTNEYEVKIPIIYDSKTSNRHILNIADCIVCSFCSKSYSEMYDHIVVMHFGGVIKYHTPCFDVKCPVMLSPTHFIEHARSHIVISPNSCNVCSFSSKTLNGVQKHIVAHKKSTIIECHRSKQKLSHHSKFKKIGDESRIQIRDKEISLDIWPLPHKRIISSCKPNIVETLNKNGLNRKDNFALSSLRPNKFYGGIERQVRKYPDRSRFCFDRVSICNSSSTLSFGSNKTKICLKRVATVKKNFELQKKLHKIPIDQIVNMKFTCQICKGVYPSNITLAKHYHNEHCYPWPFICPFENCSTRINTLHHLYCHVINHTCNSMYACTACSYSCNSKNGIGNHLKKHKKVSKASRISLGLKK